MIILIPILSNISSFKRCEQGILTLKFSRIKNAGSIKGPYKFEEPTSAFITSSPKLMDPYERSNIYIGQSIIPGKVF